MISARSKSSDHHKLIVRGVDVKLCRAKGCINDAPAWDHFCTVCSKPKAETPPHKDEFESSIGMVWVYFIICQDRIKIGQTKNLRKRISSIRTGNPFDMSFILALESLPSLEPALHDRFAEYRVTGEWFKECSGIYKFIESVKDGSYKYIFLPRVERVLTDINL
jgi:hypothetical protein